MTSSYAVPAEDVFLAILAMSVNFCTTVALCVLGSAYLLLTFAF